MRKSGNDSNNGTSPALAWLTIDKAANTMVAGDVAYIGAGTYVEEVTPSNSGTSPSPIVYIADTTGTFTGDAGIVTLDAKNGKNALAVSGKNYQQFFGLRIGGSAGKDAVSFSSCSGGRLDTCSLYTSPKDGVSIVNANVSIVGCSITGISNNGIAIDQNSTVTVSTTTIDTCGNDGIRATSSGPAVTIDRVVIANVQNGIYSDSHDLILTNALIRSCSSDGVRLVNSAGGTIWNVTLSTCSGDGIETANGSTTIRNCIMASISGVGIRKGSGSVTQSYNAYYQTTGGAHPGISTGAGEITTNPLFASGSDFHLQSASPAINGGTDASAVTTVELDGKVRPIGGGWDMGCYEYGNSYLFTDVSSVNGFNLQTTTNETYGSGLYWGDVDNDGDLDVIITGSTSRLLLNNAGASFSSSSFGGGSVWRQGALADFDNDGDLDFWAGCVGSYDVERFFRNNGSGAFSNQGDAGFSAPTNNEGVAAADIDWDGWCDVVMFSESNNYVGMNQGSGSFALSGSSATVYGFNDSGDWGNGDYCSSGDVNNDGRPDFFYHYGNGKLFLSEGDGTYIESPSGVSVVTGNSDKMGSAWGDYDNDGDLDLFVPRYASGSPSYLWRNNNGTFTNVIAAAGIADTGGHRSACWGDYDNDGDLDLYIVTVSGGNLLYRNNGNATFTLVDENVAAAGTNHDAVFVDYDNDGDLDLAVTRQGTTNVLLRNETNNSNYLKVRVVGYGGGATNKSGIGVRVELYNAAGNTLLARRDVGMSRGYGGGEPLWAHFGGINPATAYQIKVYFVSCTMTVSVTPNATSSTIGATTLAQTLTVTEPRPPMKVTDWTELDPVLP